MTCSKCPFCKLIQNEDRTSNYVCSNPINRILPHGFIVDYYRLFNKKPSACHQIKEGFGSKLLNKLEELF